MAGMCPKVFYFVSEKFSVLSDFWRLNWKIYACAGLCAVALCSESRLPQERCLFKKNINKENFSTRVISCRGPKLPLGNKTQIFHTVSQKIFPSSTFLAQVDNLCGTMFQCFISFFFLVRILCTFQYIALLSAFVSFRRAAAKSHRFNTFLVIHHLRT